ncbi:DUF5694 domain-containing protein [Symbiobacterium thermophilum]|uniref:DUF5694 domain-containing protein n=1 Tax=Symbiobacterium thermophilum TaxID=2734 RepID=UPI002357F0C2|nr:DUF5694 domain-containing protein [Symbiobacterium thermophilum]
MQERAQVMVLGTFHMENPNLDYVKTGYGDVLSEPYQQQIQEVVARLLRYRPTHVAVEAPPDAAPALQERYDQYRAGGYTLGRNEIDQLGFRTAAAMGHSRIFGIDYRLDLDFSAVLDEAGKLGLTGFLNAFERMTRSVAEAQERAEADGGVLGLLRYLNSPDHDAMHGVYLQIAAVGAGASYVGARLVADWYRRNLFMFSHIADLARQPEDRILVLVGAGHRPLLRQFITESPDLEYVDPLPYLT